MLEHMTKDGFEIDEYGVKKAVEELQKEFDKHSVRIPVETDGAAPDSLPGTSVHQTIHHAPVIYNSGDGAQMAWNNDRVTHTHNEHYDIASGFEELARTVATILDELPQTDLSEQERQETEQSARDVLTEITQPAPEHGKVRKAVRALQGCLTPLLVGGTQAAAQQWAQQLTAAL